MITKTINPIISASDVIGTIIEFRIFGILFYKKTLKTPTAYGFKGDYVFITNF
jgi:hypothetical protein